MRDQNNVHRIHNSTKQKDVTIVTHTCSATHKADTMVAFQSTEYKKPG